MQESQWAWLALAAIFLIVEMMLVSGFFLPFAVSAVLLAVGGFLLEAQPGVMAQLVVFAGLGVVLIPVTRKMIVGLRGPDDQDINKY